MNFTDLLVRRASIGGSRRSASFCRFQGRLSVDMTLSGDTNPKFAILSFRPPVSRHAGFLFRAVARDYSFCVYTVTNRNSERCLHPFGFAANELHGFCGASGVRVMPTSGTPQMPSTPNAQRPMSQWNHSDLKC